MKCTKLHSFHFSLQCTTGSSDNIICDVNALYPIDSSGEVKIHQLNPAQSTADSATLLENFIRIH